MQKSLIACRCLVTQAGVPECVGNTTWRDTVHPSLVLTEELDAVFSW